MNKEELVSIILPFFNAEPYLKQAIESVLFQTHKNIELILINDGSADGSMNIAESFANKDKRIKLITRKNKGLVHSLNEGFTLATGDYIARMDADDICFKRRIELQVKYLKKHGLDISGTSAWVINENGKIKKPIYLNMPTVDGVASRFIFRCPLLHPSVILKRKVYDDGEFVYNESEKSYEDFALWSRLVHKYKIGSMRRPLIWYRDHDFNITNSTKNDEKCKSVFELHYSFLKENKVVVTVAEASILKAIIFKDTNYGYGSIEFFNKAVDVLIKIYETFDSDKKQLQVELEYQLFRLYLASKRDFSVLKNRKLIDNFSYKFCFKIYILSSVLRFFRA